MKLNKVLVSAAAVTGIAAATSVANADSISVKQGDTLSELAEKYNTTVEAIQEANKIEDVNFITVGQQLNIPTQANSTAEQFNNVQVTSDQAAAQQAAAEAEQQKQAQEAAAQQAAAEAEQQKQAQEAAAQQAAAEAEQQKQAQEAAAQQTQTESNSSNQQSTSRSSSNLSSSEEEARAWIVSRESGGDYSARNGQYIGKYQLSESYLNGDYSEENQDYVAGQYVASRYGSWQNAKEHWETFGWY